MIRTNDFHCDTFASSSATQQRINTSDQPCDNDARKKYRAFRISSIPIVVDINTFRDYLETLAHDGSSGRYENAVTVSNIRSLTLVPHGRGKIATVVFHVVPRQLEESSPGAPVEIEFDHNGTRCRLTVDCDFFGMTPYYSSGDDAAVDIVAITGLAGNSYGSWKSPHGYSMWLRDFLPNDFPKSRVYTYGYYSVVEKSVCNSCIQDYARQLLDALTYSRQSEAASGRPLILIGHSLGGLVIKMALSEAAQVGSETDKLILRKTVGIFFFGVPNSGLNHKNLLSFVEKSEQRNLGLIRDLMEGSALLRMLNQNFVSNCSLEDCSVVSFYETMDTPTVVEVEGRLTRGGEMVRMVTRESATLSNPDPTNHIPIDGNHSTMVKFIGSDDQHYQALVLRLRECMRRAPEVIQRRVKRWSYRDKETESDHNSIDGTGGWLIALRKAVIKDLAAKAHIFVTNDELDLLATTDTGRGLLSCAAEVGSDTIAKLLLDHSDPDINARDQSGQTPLSVAAGLNRVAMVRLLLGHRNIEPGSRDGAGGTPLMWASLMGHSEVVKEFLSRHNTELNAKNNLGRTALSLAAQANRSAVNRLLLAQSNIDVNSKDNFDQTPLIWAVISGCEDAVRLLLEHKDIDVNCEDANGRTPLPYAAILGHLDIMRLLLLHIDIDVNAKDPIGRTALSLASLLNRAEMVQILLQHPKIEVDARDTFDQTPLMWAANYGCKDAMSLLLERHEADVNATDREGKTALIFACSSKKKEVVKQLLGHSSVSVNNKDNGGRTALMYAAWTNDLESVKLLLKQPNIEADTKDNLGQTPLMWAIFGGHKEVVGLLAERNDVDINSTDFIGRTPLSVAGTAANRELVQLLAAKRDASEGNAIWLTRHYIM